MLKRNALLIVDLQNDFCPGGSLAVPGSQQIVPIINQLQSYFINIIATQDWHPKDHLSFSSNHPGTHVGQIIRLDKIPQVLWPDHCVSHTKGAEFHPALSTERFKKIVYKGTDKKIDSYSAFFDNAQAKSTGLEVYLREERIKDLYLVGVATDYCIKYTALDAASLGFNVYVIVDACRGVDLKPGDVDHAFEEMRVAGIELICSKEIFARYGKVKAS